MVRHDGYAVSDTDMQDLPVLQKLDRPNKHLASVWALMPPLSPQPSPRTMQPQLEDIGEGKGSRFAKFIAERHGLLKRPVQVSNVEARPGEIFRSKL